MQDMQARLAGDARLAPFAGKRMWQVSIAGAAVMVIFIALFLMTAFITTSETGTRALSIDFRVFWGAAQLAFAGEPLAAFDMERLKAAHGTMADEWMPWLYPPGYLVLITPLGAMSFPVAFTVATLVSVLLVGLSVRPFVAGNVPLLIALALAPAYMPALLIGQNSVLWLAGLLGALAALQSGRPILAGVLIGCLTLKPQLGVLIPFALLAAGAWRTILAASVTALVLAGLPTLLYGVEYWPLLAERFAEHGQRMAETITTLDLMAGPYFLLVFGGVPPELAIKVQWGVTAAAAIAVTLVWRSRTAGFDVKVAVLLTSILLSAPYFWYYEAAMMPAIGLFMLRAGVLTPRPLHLFLLMLLWLGGGVQAMAILLGLGKHPELGALVITPVLLVAIALCLVHIAAPPAANRNPEPSPPSA